MTVHLVKLCVGIARVDELEAELAARGRRGAGGAAVHHTRHWPRRAAELLDGGSLYWVIGGAILCRQRIAGLERVHSADGAPRTAILLDRALVRTVPAPRRPFQGWRYLADAPGDLAAPAGARDLPPEIAARLADIGVL